MKTRVQILGFADSTGPRKSGPGTAASWDATIGSHALVTVPGAHTIVQGAVFVEPMRERHGQGKVIGANTLLEDSKLLSFSDDFDKYFNSIACATILRIDWMLRFC